MFAPAIAFIMLYPLLWIIVCVEFLFLMVCDEFEWFPGALFSIIVAICLINWLVGIPVFKYIYDNPFVIWSFAKFWFYLRKCVRRTTKEVLDNPAYYHEGDKSKPIRKQIEDASAFPRMSQCKAKITFWMINWPPSMLWTLINEPVRKIFKEMYRLFSKIFESMREHAIGSAEKKINKKLNKN